MMNTMSRDFLAQNQIYQQTSDRGFATNYLNSNRMSGDFSNSAVKSTLF